MAVDETRQFLILSLALMGLADALVFVSIILAVNYRIELVGYCLAVLSFVVIGALGGKEDGKTTKH